MLFLKLLVCVPFYFLLIIWSIQKIKKKKKSSSWQKVKTSIAGKVFKSLLSVAICISNN